MFSVNIKKEGGKKRHYCVASCIKFLLQGESHQIISSFFKKYSIIGDFLGEIRGILKPVALSVLHPKVKVQVVAGLQICCVNVQVTSSVLSVNVPKTSGTDYTLAQKRAALGASSNTALKSHAGSALMAIMCCKQSFPIQR